MHSDSADYKRARLWNSIEDKTVKCKLCAFRCKIPDGGKGLCLVRQNINGVLYSLNYSKICAAAVDPIEKKPLFHFQPGSKSFSIAAIGCNFKCEFCQNWQISQAPSLITNSVGEAYSPQEIVNAALERKCKTIAYTYTEPTIYFELAEETARLAKDEGLSNVFVSNGYMSSESLEEMVDWLDAINIDLKSFNNDYYQKVCKATLQPVLDTIEFISENTNIWMEITTLVVPGQNDSDDELRKIADFIAQSASPQVPWHISAFHPAYKMDTLSSTPIETLERAYEIGVQAGLKYIYLGNVFSRSGENTFCPKCGKLLIERQNYQIIENTIKNNKCPKCQTRIPGVWE